MLGEVKGRSGDGARGSRGPALALLALAMAAPASAQTGLEIMKEQSRRHQTRSEDVRIKVTQTDASGKERERELRLVAVRDDAGLTRMLLKFTAPADIRNTGLLSWDQPGDKEDDQWLYLPATKKVNRIASSSKKNPFMNTDLAYEDMLPENLDTHTYDVVREEDLGGQKCWVIEAKPSTDKEKLESGYGRRVFWVRKDLHLTAQTEFYDKSDKLIKRATFTDAVNIGGEAWRAKTARYETIARKSATVFSTLEDKVNQPVDKNLLTEQGLMRPVT